jgi:hypothetical protein
VASNAQAATNPVPKGISVGYTFETDFNTMSHAQQLAEVNEMKSAGTEWIRVDVWPNYYANAENFSRYGFKVIAILEDYGVSPYEFAGFAYQAVTTLAPHGVATYEVLNEVNENGITPVQYVPVLQAAYLAIKYADPDTTVLTSSLGPGAGSQSPSAYLEAMYQAGAGGYFDAVGVHPYSYPDLPTTADTWNTFYMLPYVYWVMVENGDSAKKIWITEFGCPTGNEGGFTAECTPTSLGEQITDAYNQASQWNWVGPVLVYDWRDVNSGGDGDFGLLNADNSPKVPALAAFEAAG